MIDAQVLTFIGLAAILTITPGADTMLVIRSVIARGQRSGLMTTAGICSGVFVHAILSAAGLSIILVNSAAAFEFVKMAGACYLIYLGYQSLREFFKGRTDKADTFEPALDGKQKTSLRSFMEGMLNNILNPKTAVFYLAFLPQFINPGDPVLRKSILLAGIHFVMAILWLSMIALMLGRMKQVLTSGRVQRWLEATSGVILIAFGIRLAMERR